MSTDAVLAQNAHLAEHTPRRSKARGLKESTPFTKAGEIDKKWILIDASGLVVGRLASIIAMRLRGKHLATFTPHMDDGDNIIVINAEKIVFTGRKREQKLYYHYSGFQGGIKERSARFILDGRFPERIVEKAVERMLPRGPLGRRQLGNLRVYKGPNHPHTAQEPALYDVAALNRKNVLETVQREGRSKGMLNLSSTFLDSGIWITVRRKDDKVVVAAHRADEKDRTPITLFWPGSVGLASLEDFFTSNVPKKDYFVNAIVFTQSEKLEFSGIRSIEELNKSLPHQPRFIRLEYQPRSTHVQPIGASSFVAWSAIDQADDVGVYVAPEQLENVAQSIANFVVKTHSSKLEFDDALGSVERILGYFKTKHLGQASLG